MNPVFQFLKQSTTTRPNFLSVGVRLCTLVAAICAAPLAFVHAWIALWLLCLMTILVLGTFAIFAYYAIKDPPSLSTESHKETMEAISVLGVNRENAPALIEVVSGVPAIENPQADAEGQQ
jgi:hypothetical protein